MKTLTINQALNRVLEIKNPTLEQQDLRFSLQNLKMIHGGRKPIENIEQVKNIIEYGTRELEN